MWSTLHREFLWSTTHKNFYKLACMCCKPHQIIMDTSLIDMNTKLALVYYNGVKPHLFRVRNDVTLSRLKDQLDQLKHKDTRRVYDVDYRRPSINSVERVHFSQMKLKNDDVRTMFSIFCQYNTKRSIMLNASLVRSFEDIRKI